MESKKQLWDSRTRRVYQKKDGSLVVVANYNYMPKRKNKDNLNPNTNAYPWLDRVHPENPHIRVPSKKHKNKYKNFLNIFKRYPR